jgi:hypothetical protein
MRGHPTVVRLRLRSPFRLLRHQPLVPARASWPSALRKKAFGYSEDLEQLHGITDTSNEMGAFMVVRADSHEDAAKLFEKHPHFTIFPGESVEVMPVLPIVRGLNLFGGSARRGLKNFGSYRRPLQPSLPNLLASEWRDVGR